MLLLLLLLMMMIRISSTHGWQDRFPAGDWLLIFFITASRKQPLTLLTIDSHQRHSVISLVEAAPLSALQLSCCCCC